MTIAPQDSRELCARLDALARARSAEHPFRGLARAGLRRLMRRYLAFSQAFPHIQAAAQHRAVSHAMERNEPIPEHVEITFAVGSYLVWDELGCWDRTRDGGPEALPEILDTRDTLRGFHVNRLRADLRALFGEELQPDFDPLTCAYLRALLDGLSSLDPVERCAWMVSFESHATPMIEALWGSLEGLSPSPRESLRYFSTHVGGDDPAEARHRDMTERMLDRVVPAAERGRFLEVFAGAYDAHVAWCAQLARGQDR